MNFDAGEGLVNDGGGETKASPRELVVDTDRHEHVVGWLCCIAVFELRVESVRRGVMDSIRGNILLTLLFLR